MKMKLVYVCYPDWVTDRLLMSESEIELRKPAWIANKTYFSVTDVTEKNIMRELSSCRVIDDASFLLQKVHLYAEELEGHGLSSELKEAAKRAYDANGYEEANIVTCAFIDGYRGEK